jgi:hypothetical protein
LDLLGTGRLGALDRCRCGRRGLGLVPRETEMALLNKVLVTLAVLDLGDFSGVQVAPVVETDGIASVRDDGDLGHVAPFEEINWGNASLW